MFENITDEMIRQTAEKISEVCFNTIEEQHPNWDAATALTIITGILTSKIAYQQLQIKELAKRIEG